MKNKNIYLCGFMGCGKTTIGRQLAVHLAYNFIDLDEYIEKEQGMTVNDIFTSKGEEYFRNCEYRAIINMDEQKHTVISTGGGALINPDNAAAAKKNGIIIYLEADFKTCYERIKDDPSRPLVKHNSMDKIKELYENRQKIYVEHSNFTINALQSPFECSKRIRDELKRFQSKL